MDWRDISRKQLLVGGIIVVAVIAIIAVPIILYDRAGEAGLQATSIVTTGLLTLALVVLYYQQFSIQSKQADLMERRLDSSVILTTTSGYVDAEDDYVYFTLRNAGRGAVRQLYLRSELIGDTGSIEIRSAHSPVIAVEGGNSLAPFSPPREFKSKVMFTLEDNEGNRDVRSFRFTARELSQERIETDIDEVTVRIFLEIEDENTRSEETIKELKVAEQDVSIPEAQDIELDGEEFVNPQVKTLSESVKKMHTPGVTNILPRDMDHPLLDNSK